MNQDCAAPGRSPLRRAAAATVEFAVVAPVLFVIVFGVIELARAYMVKHQLTDAARNGCRTGILSGTSNTDVTTTIANYLSSAGISGYNTPTIQVNGTTANCNTAASGDLVTVQVSVPVSKITWIPGMTYVKGTLHGTYSMQRE